MLPNGFLEDSFEKVKILRKMHRLRMRYTFQYGQKMCMVQRQKEKQKENRPKMAGAREHLRQFKCLCDIRGKFMKPSINDMKKSFWGDHSLAYRPAKTTVRVMSAKKCYGRPEGTVREVVYLDRVEVVVWR